MLLSLAMLAMLACDLAPPPAGAPVIEIPSPTTDPIVAAMAARPLVTTRHGECRMACRHIDTAEVKDLLRTGTIDPSRTRTDGRCPSHALEGHTDDGQHVRIVYAACPDETRLVTAIDLDREWPCDCP